jgi:NAD(P)-dependent dehydrogenase (short-subunit alcohol dehydrogenase family)
VVRSLAESHSVVGIDRVRLTGALGLDAFIEATDCTGGAVDSIVAEFQGKYPTPDALVFAQGTYTRTALKDYTPTLLRTIMWDNFEVIFHLTRRFLPSMVANGGGRIVVVTSQAGCNGALDAGYAASKGAAQSFVKSIAREYGSLGIRCNAVSPGPVETPMARAMGEDRKVYYRSAIPIGRLSDAAEVAAAVAFLATGPVDAINGAAIDIDGGLVRR